MTTLMWFRNDLRIDDNTALANAVVHPGKLRALFIATPGQWLCHDWAPVKVDFLWRNLQQLARSLADCGIPLDIAVVNDFAAVPDSLMQHCSEYAVERVYANREYPVNELARDRVVAERLAEAGIDWHSDDDALLVPPGQVLTQQGAPFKVFTPFKRRWLQWVAGRPLECLPAPSRHGKGCPVTELPQCPYEVSPVDPDLWPAGEAAAHQRLSRFIERHVDRYREQRDFPACAATSALSPYLSLGIISPRRCFEAALAVNGGEWDGGNQGVTTWISELVWREFYQHVLAAFPEVCKYRPFRPETDQVRWRHSENDFQHWCEGTTGFPLIDAAMRQLLETGWMHNRLRMVTAMFLSKYLLLDWRWGERHFMRHLVDGDLAANNGGWQWSASTGTDAAPYFRLLNPVRQSERFDQDGDFIRRWLPQLKEVATPSLHRPGCEELIAAGYPQPMIDLSSTRERALAAFKSVGAA